MFIEGEFSIYSYTKKFKEPISRLIYIAIVFALLFIVSLVYLHSLKLLVEPFYTVTLSCLVIIIGYLFNVLKLTKLRREVIVSLVLTNKRLLEVEKDSTRKREVINSLYLAHINRLTLSDRDGVWDVIIHTKNGRRIKRTWSIRELQALSRALYINTKQIFG